MLQKLLQSAVTLRIIYENMIVDSQLQIVSVVTITLLYFEIHPSCSVAYAPVYTRHRLKLAHSSVSWKISHESFFFFFYLVFLEKVVF